MQLSGYVGAQGSAAGTAYPNGYTNANIFSNAGSIANGESPQAVYCTGGSNSAASPSPFYYANTTNQIPTPSSYDGIFPGQAISLGGVYQLIATAPSATTCPSSGQNNGRLAGTNSQGELTISSNAAGDTIVPPILNGNTPYLIATNALHFSQYDTVACFGNVHDLYRTLLKEGAAYYQGDAILSKFMKAMQGTVHEKLVAADTLLLHAGTDSTKINAALNHNNGFVPQGAHDRYLQAVNNLFAAHVKQKHGLNATQIQNLKSIAQLCPYQYGEGVFRARALLSRFDATKYINPCEQPAFPQKVTTAGRMEATDINTIATLAKTSIFPNPNSGSFSISYEGNAKQLSIEVYNILGALVASQPATTENGSSVTQISGLPEGVYMIRLNGDGALIKTERIIVTK